MGLKDGKILSFVNWRVDWKYDDNHNVDTRITKNMENVWKNKKAL